jgi:hypothetical protein
LRTNPDTLRGVEPILDIRFYATELGGEPVREWLKLLPAIDRKVIGEDMKKQATSQPDLDLAKDRLKQLRRR